MQRREGSGGKKAAGTRRIGVGTRRDQKGEAARAGSVGPTRGAAVDTSSRIDREPSGF